MQVSRTKAKRCSADELEVYKLEVWIKGMQGKKKLSFLGKVFGKGIYLLSAGYKCLFCTISSDLVFFIPEKQRNKESIFPSAHKF